ncbi:MAG: T9SS type A sorting domain-containing protein [Bacteroidales bacterium]|nr:T9SS type A sorting domain-containing protein [Bacteroidales bacterium]MDZ4204647.1 T9SS type A sorting domain-containing protein [Bacteroidales bacterium]
MRQTALIIALFLTFGSASSQITHESTYNYSGTYIKLANSGYKFFVMDVPASQCRIYNTNHILWKTINLNVPVNHYLYDILFVSENLFTTDNSLCMAYIYYNYNTTGQYYTYTAKVVKENGTELLSVPGCQYVYMHSMGGVGTKMLTYSYDYSSFPYAIQTRVYDLPGQLVSGASTSDKYSDAGIKAFPNPAQEFSTIRYELPDGILSGELVITDPSGKIVKTINIDRNSGHTVIPTSQYPSGIYLYFIRTGNYHSKAEKLIIH